MNETEQLKLEGKLWCGASELVELSLKRKEEEKLAEK